METLRKAAPFEVKDFGEDGQFTGLASVYGNVDLGGDIVQRGAFTKTLSERGTKRTLKYMHREAIGAAELTDTEDGLLAKGALNLELPKAQEVYSNLKFWRNHGMKAGMSIGFLAMDAEPKGRARVLKDLNLFEVTVTDPGLQMNQEADVFGVKSLEADEESILSVFREMKSGDPSAIGKLRALLAAAGYATADDGAAHKSSGPVLDHSLLVSINSLLRGK